jgi:succinate-semialdehyde dehydrogenase/glutarate-semialdehyde dehydrogenase
LELIAPVTAASRSSTSSKTIKGALHRIYVQDGVYKEFAERFVQKVKDFKLGGGFEEGILWPPMTISAPLPIASCTCS